MPLTMFSAPRLRADGALFGEVHRRSQATGTQQQGQFGGLALAFRPVIRNWLPSGDWMVARLMIFFSS